VSFKNRTKNRAEKFEKVNNGKTNKAKEQVDRNTCVS